jgi:predicted transcriptional regulator
MKYRANTEITIEIIELMAKGDSKITNIRFKAYLSFSYHPKKKKNYREGFERALKYKEHSGTILDNY